MQWRTPIGTRKTSQANAGVDVTTGRRKRGRPAYGACVPNPGRAGRGGFRTADHLRGIGPIMTIMTTELYDAFVASGTPEDKARKAAEVIAAHETRIGDIERKQERLGTLMAAGFERLEARIDQLEAKIEHSDAAHNAKIEHTAATLNAKIDQTAATLNAKIDQTATTLNAKIDQTTATLNAMIEQTATTHNAKIEHTATTHNAKIEHTATTLNAKIDQNFATVNAKIDREVTALRGDIKLIRWMLGLVIAGVFSLVLKAFFV